MNKKLCTLIVLIAILTIEVSGCASIGNNGASIEQLLEKANQGDPVAQFKIARIYYRGTGVPKNAVEAANWLRKSAEQGNPEAQNSLGFQLQEGEGVPQNYTEAVKWYQKAADQNFSVSVSNLGNMYKSGLGVEKNLKRSFELYHRAAELGGTRGMNNLGYAYWKGEGTKMDLVQAYAWFDLARLYTQQSDDMQLKWGIRGALDQVKGQMTKAQIDAAHTLTKELEKKLNSK